MFKWIRIPKAAALLAFLLPWVTVSCQGQQIASGSGFGLAFGSMQSSLPNAGDVPTNLWLILAIAALIGGIAATFWNDSRAPLASLATSAAALVLTWIGTSRYSASSIAEAAAENPGAGGAGMDSAMLAMINVEWHIGFWIASLAMLVAVVMAWLTYSGKADDAETRIRAAVATGAGSLAAAAAQAKDAASDAAAKAGEVAGDAKDSVVSAASNARETVSDAASSALDTATDAANKARDTVADAIRSDDQDKPNDPQ